MNNSPINQSRRRFLKRSAIILGGTGALTATSLPVYYYYHSQNDGPAYQYWQQKQKGDLSDQEYIVMCGILAASPHNTQPWKFQISGLNIRLFADHNRNLGVADPARRMMLMAIGCALENMEVAAAQLGYQLNVIDLDADKQFEANGYCATVQLVKNSPKQHPWFESLFQRQTARTIFDRHEIIPELLLTNLSHQSTFPGVKMAWLRSETQLNVLDELNQAAVRLFVSSDERQQAGMRWFRITRQEWTTHRDGISLFTSDLPWYVKQAIEWFVTKEELLSESFKQGEIDFMDRVSPATPLWGLIYGEQATHNTRVLAGRVAERVYLETTAQGYAIQPISYPTELPKMSQRLRQLFGIADSTEPLFLFRAGRAPFLERSVRRDLAKVLM